MALGAIGQPPDYTTYRIPIVYKILCVGMVGYPSKTRYFLALMGTPGAVYHQGRYIGLIVTSTFHGLLSSNIPCSRNILDLLVSNCKPYIPEVKNTGEIYRCSQTLAGYNHNL
jgi:hypothetical protein